MSLVLLLYTEKKIFEYNTHFCTIKLI